MSPNSEEADDNSQGVTGRPELVSSRPENNSDGLASHVESSSATIVPTVQETEHPLNVSTAERTVYHPNVWTAEKAVHQPSVATTENMGRSDPQGVSVSAKVAAQLTSWQLSRQALAAAEKNLPGCAFAEVRREQAQSSNIAPLPFDFFVKRALDNTVGSPSTKRQRVAPQQDEAQTPSQPLASQLHEAAFQFSQVGNFNSLIAPLQPEATSHQDPMVAPWQSQRAPRPQVQLQAQSENRQVALVQQRPQAGPAQDFDHTPESRSNSYQDTREESQHSAAPSVSQSQSRRGGRRRRRNNSNASFAESSRRFDHQQPQNHQGPLIQQGYHNAPPQTYDPVQLARQQQSDSFLELARLQYEAHERMFHFATPPAPPSQSHRGGYRGGYRGRGRGRGRGQGQDRGGGPNQN